MVNVDKYHQSHRFSLWPSCFWCRLVKKKQLKTANCQQMFCGFFSTTATFHQIKLSPNTPKFSKMESENQPLEVWRFRTCKKIILRFHSLNFRGVGTLPKINGWNLEMMVSNRNLLFQGSIFRFRVCFGGCIFIWKLVLPIVGVSREGS